jgi:phosphoglycolate phosphatase
VDKLVSELIDHGHTVGLVTGNLSQIAKIKLERVGIEKLFTVGGYGDISEKRSDLVKEAIKQTTGKFSKENIFVIGDTPHDIKAGKDNGTKTIAVLGYGYNLKELKKCKPDFLFKDFKNYKKVLKTIES